MYRGRFAPSPTGPLHFGSLVAALGSYLDARHQSGQWLVRIEDLDPPREVPGAAQQILATLEDFGLEWDGPIVYQSGRTEHYRDALTQLRKTGLCYPCGCTRKEIRQRTARRVPTGKGGLIYPGTCRRGLQPGRTAAVTRIRTPSQALSVDDLLQGSYSQQLERDCGDFVLLRRDGYFAYQLAVVVDDFQQGVTHVVRGCDLLDSTPRQIYLCQLLRYPVPSHMHLPIAVDADGQKLSKKTGALPLGAEHREQTLMRALEFLGQAPPPELAQQDLSGVLGWATEHWDPSSLKNLKKIRIQAN